MSSLERIDSGYKPPTGKEWDDCHCLQTALLSLGITTDDLIEGSEPMLVNAGNSFLVIGLYVFSFDGVGDRKDAGARMFAPRYDILEESATGMGAGPLTGYLHERARFYPSPDLMCCIPQSNFF